MSTTKAAINYKHAKLYTGRLFLVIAMRDPKEPAKTGVGKSKSTGASGHGARQIKSEAQLPSLPTAARARAGAGAGAGAGAPTVKADPPINYDSRLLGILKRAHVSNPVIREINAVHTLLTGEIARRKPAGEATDSGLRLQFIIILLSDIERLKYKPTLLDRVIDEALSKLSNLLEAYPEDENIRQLCAAVSSHCPNLARFEAMQIIRRLNDTPSSVSLRGGETPSLSGLGMEPDEMASPETTPELKATATAKTGAGAGAGAGAGTTAAPVEYARKLPPLERDKTAQRSSIDRVELPPVLEAAKYISEYSRRLKSLAPGDQRSKRFYTEKLDIAQRELRHLLEQDVDADIADEDGNTAAHIIAASGDAESMAILIRLGAKVNRSNKAGETPMFIAQKEFLPPIIGLIENAHFIGILTAPISCNVKNAMGVSPILLHVLNGDHPSAIENVNFLLSKGASAEVTMKHDVLRQCLSEHLPRAQFHSARVQAFLDPKTSSSAERHFNLAELAEVLGFRELGATIEENNRLAVEAKANPGMVIDRDGTTLTHKAAQVGSEALICRLASRGDFTRRNAQGYTPFSFLVMRGKSALIDKIFEEIVDIEIRRDKTNGEGVGLRRIQAIVNADPNIILHVVSAAAEFSEGILSTRSNFASRLYATARLKDFDQILTRLVISAGRHKNKQNAEGKTAVHLAAKSGNLEALQTLTRYGASHSIRDANGRTPLFDAAAAGRIDVLPHLLRECRTPINDKDAFGATPALLALLHRHVGTYQFLCDSGAEKAMSMNKDDFKRLLSTIEPSTSAAVADYLARIDNPAEEHYNINLDDLRSALSSGSIMRAQVSQDRGASAGPEAATGDGPSHK
jgi:ankyrin repeat protein